MTGRARDLLTDADGEGGVLATTSFQITASVDREILDILAAPPHPNLQDLVGARAGGASRTALEAALGDARGSPLYQLIDDFAGASLVANGIWASWNPAWDPGPSRRKKMEDICTGFAAGASSLLEDGTVHLAVLSRAEVGPLEDPADPLSWHELPMQVGPKMRRARRIDLWREGDVIKVDAYFQDSGGMPSGMRLAIHEYRVYAEVEEGTGRLLALQALPLVLPFRECPGASVKATRLVGRAVADFRASVPEVLGSTLGCTHLNDVLRGLADVPLLATLLPKGG